MGMSNTHIALQEAAKMVQEYGRTQGKPIVILLTDGTTYEHPTTLAAQNLQANATVHVVAIGRYLNPDLAMDWATSGAHFHQVSNVDEIQLQIPNLLRSFCSEGLACNESPTGWEYRGCKSQTVSGRTCQRWLDTSPHTPYYTVQNTPARGLGDHNFCRSPDMGSRIWCYTQDANVEWEYCDPRTTK